MQNSFIRSIFIFFITTVAYIATFAQVIPTARYVDWSVAGLQGEKPQAAVILNVMDFGAVADGIANDHPAVVAAIDSLNGRMGMIYFPPGEYLLNSNLNLPDSIILKGASSDSSVLKFDLNGSGVNCIEISKPQTGSYTSVAGGFHKGSVIITVADATGFAGAIYAEMVQDNGSWDTNPATWAEESVGQMLWIDSVAGNNLYLQHPLRLHYDTALNLRVRPVTMKRAAGIECLGIERVDTPSAAGYNVNFRYAAACWVQGIESFKSAGSHISINTSTNIEVKGSYIHHAFVYDGSGTRGYGITLLEHTGECLIADNIFRQLRHAMMVKQGANGNVFAYNYSIEPYRTEFPSDYSGDISLHGHYAFANLFEGNIVQNIITDHYWGPSGPYNTLFRNRAEYYGLLMTNAGSSPLNTDTQNIVGNEITNSGFLLGNYSLLGKGHLEYGNNVLGNIRPAGTGNLSDTSYYLKERPDYLGSIPGWPAIGVPGNLGSGTIPAKERFLNGIELTACGYPPLPIDTADTTGLAGSTALLEVNIYPNPFGSALNVQVKTTYDEDITIRIYNLLGSLIYQGQINPGHKVDNLRIEATGKWGTGLFLLQLTGPPGKTYQKKIIKID